VMAFYFRCDLTSAGHGAITLKSRGRVYVARARTSMVTIGNNDRRSLDLR